MCQIMFQMISHLYRFFFRPSQENIDTEDMNTKLTKMEEKIANLEEKNKELQKQLDYNRNKEVALQKVLCNYDNLLKKVIMDKHTNSTQDETTIHLANLESAFYDLLQKYEKAKLIVLGFQQNETVLKKQVDEYEDIIENLKTKFMTHKSLSDNRFDLKNLLKKTKSVETKKRRLTSF